MKREFGAGKRRQRERRIREIRHIKGSSKKEGNGQFPLLGQSWAGIAAREMEREEINTWTRKPRERQGGNLLLPEV